MQTVTTTWYTKSRSCLLISSQCCTVQVPKLIQCNLLILLKSDRVIPIFDENLWQDVRKKIEDEWKTDKDIDSRVNWVKQCLEKRNHMTVFRLDGANTAKDIDLAILQALLKGDYTRKKILKKIWGIANWGYLGMKRPCLRTEVSYKCILFSKGMYVGKYKLDVHVHYCP